MAHEEPDHAIGIGHSLTMSGPLAELAVRTETSFMFVLHHALLIACVSDTPNMR